MRSSNNYSISHFSVYCDERETRRVDTYLSALFPEKSRSYLQKMIEEGKIFCNGANFTKNKKIYRGDEIRIEWKIENMELLAENLPIDIIFENDDFAIINKDAGMNTHPTPGEEGRKGSLVNALLYHFKSLGIRTDDGEYKNPSIINGVERPGIVHRLDKDTSGLIIIAKNDKAMHALQLKIAKRTISKTYLALVFGRVKDEEGYIESFIGRDPFDRKKMTTRDPVNPKIAKTKFRKLGYHHEKYTLLEIDLLTGRTHQIRVHLSSIGFPIVGDKIYGNEKINREVEEHYALKRQWLHAWKLSFNLFGKDYTFEGPIKDDLQKVID
ncbi:MAG: RluA family pseudouridine synthase [Candidatus Altimarinota bacterium]